MTGNDAAHEAYLMARGAGRWFDRYALPGGGRGGVCRVVCGFALSYDPPMRFEAAGQGGIEGSSPRADLVGNGGDRSW